MHGGFSARSIDTKSITPTLKELGLPAMAESGWLTRSLEQPYPYDYGYEGSIKVVKTEFLDVVNFYQEAPDKTHLVIKEILRAAEKIKQKSNIKITRLSNPEKISISHVVKSINEFLDAKYKKPGKSKIPVIIFYTMYEILIEETYRYKDKQLRPLGSHTAADSNAKSSGDIEILDGEKIFESVEIKYGSKITTHIIRRAIDKIKRHNPKRYYILSTDTEGIDDDEINGMVLNIKKEHGCQLIVNGFTPTIKYYLRLMDDTRKFINYLSHNIENDRELKVDHKEKWEEIINKMKSDT